MLTCDDQLIPIIEINGRFTLSTYTSFLSERYKNKIILSFYSKLRFSKLIDYTIIVNALKQEKLWLNKDGDGGFIYTAETLNSILASGNCRAFCIVIESDEVKIRDVYRKIQMVLEKIMKNRYGN